MKQWNFEILNSSAPQLLNSLVPQFLNNKVFYYDEKVFLC